MKKTFLFLISWLCCMSVMAQAPNSFTYQAVVRNDSNKLVTNAQVGIQASIKNQNGAVIYSERHTAETNENGLLTIEIGNGSNASGVFSNIQWDQGGYYYLCTDIDPKGGTNYTLSITQRLLSVPYALYANKAGNTFSGDYNDLTNKPDLFSGHYEDLVDTPTFATVARTGKYPDLVNKPTFAPVATSGSYNDLSGTPNLATVATTGSYTDLSNTPSIPTLPTGVGAFTNDAGYISVAQASTILNALYQRIDSLQQFIAHNITCCNNNNGSMDTIPGCPGTAVVLDFDGNMYRTVQIGAKCWMRENLRSTHYADGSAITGMTAPNNNSSLVPAYGYLYTHSLAMHGASAPTGTIGVQGICPAGWHVPSYNELQTITSYVSGQSAYHCNGTSNHTAKALASTTGWASSTTVCAVGNDPSANNGTGFAAMPAGSSTGSYGQFAYIWSCTNNGTAQAYKLQLSHDQASPAISGMGKGTGLSVRCVKD